MGSGKRIFGTRLGSGGLPDANEVDVDIYRERFLEQRTLLPASPVHTGVHLVRKRDLLAVARGQEPNLVQHPGEGPRGVRAPRESEQADFVPRLVCQTVWISLRM